jgi:hypothetical protein
MTAGDPTHETDPVLRIVRGTPTPEEVAALVGALLLRARPALDAPPVPLSAWRRSARPGAAGPSGRPLRPEPDGWRHSARPR